MRNEALQKLAGFNAWNFIIYSKHTFDSGEDDQKILEEFKAKFKDNLPLHHIDMVLID